MATSQAWLKEGIVPDGDFEEAAKGLQAAYVDAMAKSKKPRSPLVFYLTLKKCFLSMLFFLISFLSKDLTSSKVRFEIKKCLSSVFTPK